MSEAVWVRCATCGRSKAPRGRSVPMEMYGALCTSNSPACAGYEDDPQPDCRWPGEAVCGPGCTKGGEDK